MMKKLNKTVWVPVLTASLLGLAVSNVYAGGQGCNAMGSKHSGQGMGQNAKNFNGRGDRMDSGMKADRLARKLDLEDGQQTQVAAIIDESQIAREALRDKMRGTTEALNAAMLANNQAQVRTLADQKGDLMADMIVMRAKKRSQINDILTPAQQEQFAQMKGGRMNRH